MDHLPEPKTANRERSKMVPLGLEASDYETPEDRQARERLSKLADLKRLSKHFASEVAEPWITSRLAANSVKVSDRQFPGICTLASQIAAILNVPPPAVYIQQGAIPNAFTHGTGRQSFLAISHSLVEQLSCDELAFIIGHEMGHIKSDHVVYTTVAHWLLEDEARHRQESYSSLAFQLLNWMRKSETSADRAGLIVSQDIEAACRALLTLAIGSRRLAGHIDILDYAESQRLSLQFNPASDRLLPYESHPFMPERIRDLIDFHDSAQYRDLFNRALTLPGNMPDSPL